MWIMLGITVIAINVNRHYNSVNDTLEQDKEKNKTHQTSIQYLYTVSPTTTILLTNYSFKSIEVNKGHPFQLDCNRENLPLEIPLIWEKSGASNDVIAIGSKIISHEYRQRAKLINQHNTLAINHSDLIDSGKYICSAAIPDEPPIIEYNVEVKIKHNLV